MVETTQQKFLRLLGLIAAKKNFEMVVDHKFGNAGFARLQRAGSLVSVLTVYFDFQTDSAGFNFAPEVEGMDRSYRKYDELPKVLDAIKAFLDERAA